MVVLCAQYTIMAMTSAEKAQWNEEEMAGLVDYLYEHRLEIGNAGMFKSPTYTAAAEHIAPCCTAGTVKTCTGQMCKMKWQAVCIYVLYLSPPLMYCFSA